MKFNLIFVFISFILLSCEDPAGDPNFNGFTFRVSNSTNENYDGKLLIGGFLNGKFYATDSVSFVRPLKIGGASLESHFVDENRWKPNILKIKNLPSDRCFFKLKLSNGREELLGLFNSTGLFSLLIPGDNNFNGRFGFYRY